MSWLTMTLILMQVGTPAPSGQASAPAAPAAQAAPAAAPASSGAVEVPAGAAQEAVAPGSETAGTATDAPQAGQAPAAGPLGCGGGDMVSFAIWMVFLFGLMYFLLIRPQKKQQKAHQELMASLKKGDRVVTTSGILGTIRSVADPVISVEVTEGVVLRFRKEHIAGLQAEPKSDKPEGKSESK